MNRFKKFPKEGFNFLGHGFGGVIPFLFQVSAVPTSMAPDTNIQYPWRNVIFQLASKQTCVDSGRKGTLYCQLRRDNLRGAVFRLVSRRTKKKTAIFLVLVLLCQRKTETCGVLCLFLGVQPAKGPRPSKCDPRTRCFLTDSEFGCVFLRIPAWCPFKTTTEVPHPLN